MKDSINLRTNLRAACPHFDAWVSSLERLGPGAVDRAPAG